MLIKKNKINFNIFLQSADKIALYNYKNKIENLLKREKYIYNISYIPTNTKYYHIIRSPHVYKKSIETFEEKIYSINFKLTILDLKNYKKLIYISKFLKNNIPLNINIIFKLKNNVKTNIL